MRLRHSLIPMIALLVLTAATAVLLAFSITSHAPGGGATAAPAGELPRSTATAIPLSPTATPRAPMPAVAAATASCGVTDASADADELAFLALINEYRAQHDLSALTISPTLSRAAAWKSHDMADNEYFAHDDLSRSWVERIHDCGYTYNVTIGENLAGGYESPRDVLDAWKASPEHDENMLTPAYNAIGIARVHAPGTPFEWYWSTDFGGR